MQDRRYRPGDVVDDYCPRERRITDHAIVAMIDDAIQKTRCGSCDAEHDYKEGKVPAPRRKTPPPGLFNQVLDNAIGPTPPHSVAAAAPPAAVDTPVSAAPVDEPPGPVAATSEEPARTEPVEPMEPVEPSDGGFRRSLIRATFPRPDGTPPTPRANPEFTLQTLNNRGRNNGSQRHAGGQNKFRGRRRPGGVNLDNIGPMRFRDQGHGQSDGRSGQGQGGGGRRRRGGKKNR
jgi:hypothetical protein